MVQDTDVFDTWFSSGQWTFAPLLAQTNSQQETRNKKQNEEVCGLYGAASKEFEEFYPTAVMETGWDILFFWVARMIMLGLYATDEVPFKNVYLHGLVRDKDRQKMSKSKGNVIDPLGVASEYGTDAVRMALVFGTAAGNDIIISEDKIRGMRNFANKIWNISRFILINLENANLKSQISKSQFKIQNVNEATKQDKGILDELDKTVKEMTRLIEGYRFNQAGELIYDFIWHKLADVYLEESKSQISNPKIRENTLEILQYVLATSLKLLHPFMPYITEEIWGKLPGEKQPLIITGWPE